MLEARPALCERYFMRLAVALAHRLIESPLQTRVEHALRTELLGEDDEVDEVAAFRQAQADKAQLEELKKVIDQAVLERAPIDATIKKKRIIDNKKERERTDAKKLRDKFDLPEGLQRYYLCCICYRSFSILFFSFFFSFVAIRAFFCSSCRCLYSNLFSVFIFRFIHLTPLDELLVTRAVCNLHHKKIKSKSELFVFQSCLAIPYRNFGLSHRFRIPYDDIMSLDTEGGNTILLESRDPVR